MLKVSESTLCKPLPPPPPDPQPSPGLIGLIEHDSNATSPESTTSDNGFLPIQNYKQLVNKCQVSHAGFTLPLPEYILFSCLSENINTVVPLLKNMLCLQGFNKTHQRRYNILATKKKVLLSPLSRTDCK